MTASHLLRSERVKTEIRTTSVRNILQCTLEMNSFHLVAKQRGKRSWSVWGLTCENYQSLSLHSPWWRTPRQDEGVTGSANFFCLAEAFAQDATPSPPPPSLPAPTSAFTPDNFLCLSSKLLKYCISMALSPDAHLDSDVESLEEGISNFLQILLALVIQGTVASLPNSVYPICHLALLIQTFKYCYFLNSRMSTATYLSYWLTAFWN